MMKFFAAFPFVAAAALFVPGVAGANSFAATPGPTIGFQVSSLGAGVQVSKQIGFATDVRLTTGNFEFNRSGTTNEFSYSGNAHLRNISALIDFHPMQSPFALTAGLLFSHDGADIIGTPQGGAYTLNGHTYTAAQIGAVNGFVHLGNIAPYVGIGLGQPRHARVFLTGDLGIAFRPVQTSLSATGAATALPQFTEDLAKTRTDISRAAGFLRTYPVISLGLAVRS